MKLYALGIAVVLAAATAQAQSDICGGLDLTDSALADCRRQYDEAQSDAARAHALDTFRNRPSPHYATPSGHPRAPARFMTGTRREETGCERWALPAEEIRKCRADVRAARTDDAKVKVLARYQAIAADLKSRGE